MRTPKGSLLLFSRDLEYGMQLSVEQSMYGSNCIFVLTPTLTLGRGGSGKYLGRMFRVSSRLIGSSSGGRTCCWKEGVWGN